LDRNVICFFANVSFRGGSNSSRYPVIAWTCVVTWIAAQTLYQRLGLHAIQVLARFAANFKNAVRRAEIARRRL